MQFEVYSALFLTYLSVNILRVTSYSFNSENVIVISQDSVKDTYFSYSLLLQTGERTSSLIVGAPKNIHNPGSGGDLYKCDINTNTGSTCVQYPIGRAIDSSTTNGNFFGMSLDGDSNANGPLVACAPRTLPTNKQLNFLRGYCIYMKNTSYITQPPVEIIPLTNAGTDSACCDSGNKAYYNLGFAMAGFDVSFYSEAEILLGAPGIKKFNGAAISYSLNDSRIINVLPYRSMPVLRDEDTYFGYSVTSAQFRQNSNHVWYIAGAPRANNLKGKVTIFFYDVRAREKMFIVTRFEGDEVGSYFGASVLAVDVSNDRVVDVLVGAPMASGKTWDEGSVYFYKGLNEMSFLRRVKLTGSSKIGSRFGTAIVSLGDFDLDGFNDVAISAPYEDDGIGAVYVYKGSREGLTDQYSQRLSPADFKIGSMVVRGFGMGLSKGNDIDGNGHNDIAIGAYKSDQVFIVNSYSIIDYQMHLTPDINSITNSTTSFNLEFCLLYTKRTEKNILREVDFHVDIQIDYRSLREDIIEQVIANLGQNMCKIYGIQLRQTVMDISPFQISLRLETKTDNLIAHGEKSLDIQIPYSHGCGDDNICQTELSVELKANRGQLVLGLDKEINLNIRVINNNEPAYRCEVKLLVPDGIDLRNAKDCVKTEGKYTCLLNERLIGSVDKDFVFDLKDITPDTHSIEIGVEVVSLGINSGNKDKTQLELPIILESTPYIIGKSIPENMELEINTIMKEVEVVHQFSVGKNGPSPLLIDVEILIPIVEQDEEYVFSIVDVEGNVDNVGLGCTTSVTNDKTTISPIDDIRNKIALNRTVLITPNTEENYLKFSCKGEYLYNSGQLAIFKVRLLIKSKLLVSKYRSQLSTRDLVAFVPVAYQRNSDGWIGASGLFLIFVHGVKYVPLWVYLLAPSIGVILLILITFGLYKCHFFDRIYKDKLEQEKILISDNDATIEDEIFDNVVFRSMKENVENKEREYL